MPPTRPGRPIHDWGRTRRALLRIYLDHCGRRLRTRYFEGQIALACKVHGWTRHEALAAWDEAARAAGADVDASAARGWGPNALR